MSGTLNTQYPPPARRTFVEYFASTGLVRMGLEPLEWKVVFANDFAPQKHEMYKAFFPDADHHYKVADIFDVDPTRDPPRPPPPQATAAPAIPTSASHHPRLISTAQTYDPTAVFVSSAAILTASTATATVSAANAATNGERFLGPYNA